jgi:hypothetical protein
VVDAQLCEAVVHCVRHIGKNLVVDNYDLRTTAFVATSRKQAHAVCVTCLVWLVTIYVHGAMLLAGVTCSPDSILCAT